MFKILIGLLLSSVAYGYSGTIVGIGGVTMHGPGFDERFSEYMPKKMTDDGRYVLHQTELNIIGKDWWKQWGISILKDCFDEWVININAGPRLGWFDKENLDVGVVGGLYLKKELKWGKLNPDDFDPIYRYKNYSVFPMGFFTISYRMSRVVVQVAANFAINHLTVGYLIPNH